MRTTPTLKNVLLAAAGSGTILSAGGLLGCSSKVKVQRVEYPEPTPHSTQELATNNTQPAAETQAPFQLAVLRPESNNAQSKPEPLSTIELAREALESIYDIDAKLVASTLQEDPNRIHSLESIAMYDRQHAQKLMTIIDRFGWPTRELVGLKAVQGAYIAVQHAGHDPEFQSNCLTLIQQQVDQGDLPGAFLALMTDRISVSRGDSQIYGTQMTMASDDYGVMRAVPAAEIWKQSELDQRRQSLGMPSHQRFVEAIELAYFNSINQPNSQTNSQVSSVPTE